MHKYREQIVAMNVDREGLRGTNFSEFVIVLSNKSPEAKLSPDVKGVPPKGGFVRMKTLSPFINIAVTSPLFHSQPEIIVLEKLIASGSAPASRSNR